MPEGTAVLTNNGGAGAGAAGAGAGGADAAAAAAGAAAAGGGEKPWYGDVTPELKTWVDGKQYKDPATALAAHMAAEKLIGAPADRVLKLPEKSDDPAWSDVYTKLGRPAKAEDYELAVPAGDGGEFAKTAAQWLFAAGVPKAAGQAIAKQWNEYFAVQVAKAEESDQRTSAAALAELRTQWGSAAAEREELARRGLSAFGKQAGLDDADLIKLENSIGTVKMLKIFSEVGKLTAEAKFVGGSGQAFTMTRDEAQAKLNTLRADPAWAAAYLKGDANKKTEMTQLMEIITAS